MARFELTDLPVKPQEGMMQASEKATLKDFQKEKAEDAAKTNVDDAKALGSVFYPLAEALRSALLAKAEMLPVTVDETKDLQEKLAVAEAAYGGNKVSNPATHAIASFVAPFVRGFVDKAARGDLSKWLGKKKDENNSQAASSTDLGKAAGSR